jgi:putative oxidoreductase
MKTDLGLLLLRVIFGGSMLLGHGLSKLTNFSEYAERFGDPIGMGPKLSLIATIGTEFFCALAIVVGVMTRLVSLPLVFTMAVAFFLVHADDPFKSKELAFLYGNAFLVIAFLGPGKYSVDGMYGRR